MVAQASLPAGRPLRVTFVIQKLFGLTGGAERIVLQTAKEMAARGMQVNILVYDRVSGEPGFDPGDIEISNTMPLLLRRRGDPVAGRNDTPGLLKAAPHGGVAGHVKWMVTHGLFARCLAGAMRRCRPDVIVGVLPPGITAAVAAGQRLDIPVIAATHNVPEQDFDQTSPRWDQNPVYRMRARTAVSRATAITVLQEDFRDWFAPDAKKRVAVVPNPVSRLSPAPPVPETRDKLVLAVGRLAKVKQFDVLIHAWKRVHQAYPDWRVALYGDGPERPTLAALIDALGLQSTVRLCGVERELGPVYDRASLLCHPARFEGFGLVVAEAMAHGTPVLGFDDCPGIDQLITDGVDGWRIRPGTDRITALADGLRQILDDPTEIRVRGTAATAITERFSAQRYGDTWEHLIRTVAKAR